MMLLVDVFAYLVPGILAHITDIVYPSIIDREEQAMRSLWLSASVIAITAVARGIAIHIMIRAFWLTAEATVRDIRNALYAKLQHLEISYYDIAQTGDLMSRATYDVQLIRNFIAFGIEHRVRIILIGTTIFILMLLQDWRLAFAIYTIIPLFVLAIIHYGGKMRSAVVIQQRQMGQLNSRLQESVTGIRVIKAFAVEEEVIERFDVENQLMLQRDLDAALPQAYLTPVLLITEGVAALVLIVIGGYRVMNGTAQLGTIVAFIIYLGIMSFPLRILAFNTALLNLARGATSRINEILDTPDQTRHDNGTRRDQIVGRLSFDQVSFRYGSGPCVLDDISFDVEPGSHIGIFGLTGSGKSTLISLIPRFYLPTSGQICIDGLPIDEWELQTLREQVGTVLQETFLFSATIRENIGFGRDSATIAEIENAARTAEIHEFIMSLPRGYDTMVGEYGVGLSGGQRQRIAIARTIVQDPRILILDDCTSSLDAVTERQILEQLKHLMRDRTTIIVAQRLSTLSLADRVIVLDDGYLQAIDHHDKLIINNDLYRRMWRQQRPGKQFETGEESWR
jgi:ATP-binding cassette subfamily B protein